ncbi:hypothetical protein [Helicobacter cetorum]|uniref:hypothetical protein n=1 Tax=Helicobacter cetorum TaxID=138563 RepID=UPI000CF1B0EF|nr:hypothetical protein [Helicobacter cetorum]
MKQLVKNVSYLCETSFKLDSEVKELVGIPSGAIITSLNLEIKSPSVNASEVKVDIGLKDKQDYFLNDIKANVTTKENVANFTTHDIKQFNQSTQLLSSLETQIICAHITNPIPTDNSDTLIAGECVLRVIYFLPSNIEVEY